MSNALTRSIDLEVQRNLYTLGLTIPKLLQKLKDGLESERSVFVDGVGVSVPDREHQRWSWDRVAKLMKLMGYLDEPPANQWSASLDGNSRAELILRIKNLVVDTGGTPKQEAIDVEFERVGEKSPEEDGKPRS